MFWPRTQIQIATRTFYFELPPSHPVHDTPDTTPEADIDPTSADDPLQPLSPGPSSPPPVAVSRKRRRPSHDQESRSPSPTPAVSRRRNSLASKATAKGKGQGKGKGKGNPAPARKVQPPPKPATPEPDDSSDDEQLVSINDLHQDELDELQAVVPSDHDAEGDEAQDKPLAKKPAAKPSKGRDQKKPAPASKGLLAPPAKAQLPCGPSTSQFQPAPVPKEAYDPSQPRQPKKYMTQRLIAKAEMQKIPRPPPDQMPPKPPYTYAILCYRAISDLGGKASLSEIVNWIREKYEWYRWNDECGWEVRRPVFSLTETPS